MECSGDDRGKQDICSVYTGETSRCQHLRGSEHLSGLLNKQPGNALYKHVTDVHDGELVDFKRKVVRRHNTCLFRQVHEAVRLDRISKHPGVKILNSRGEFNRCKLVRLQVSDEFKDPNDQGDVAKYTLPLKQPKDDRDFRRSKDKPKVNDSSSDQANQLKSQSTSNLNDFPVTNSNKAAIQQTESKPNVLEAGKVNKQQPRRVYKYVASNFRIRKKFDVKDFNDPRTK